MSPSRFEIDPEILLAASIEIDDRDEVFWAIYSTDPIGTWSRPSSMDISLHHYPDALRIFATLAPVPGLSGWLIQEGTVTAVPLQIIAA